jgi:hydroxymethylpyrimidine/phosphomethylpyrimidine kinase
VKNPLQNDAGKPPIALTIAGFDPSNGAGITADLQVFAVHGIFGTSAITALTVQSTLGVAQVQPLDPTIFRHTLNHLTADLPPAGIKIGMLGNAAIARELADFLKQLDQIEAGNPNIPIILDPVILSSSGTALLDPTGLEILRNHLLPKITWLTPNWQELALITGEPVTTQQEARHALETLAQTYPHLHTIATAGDQPHPTDLLRTPAGQLHELPGTHVETNSTHGTGCAFSSALLSRLILGDQPLAAVTAAKAYIEGALRNAPNLGHGRGPMNLLWPLRSRN